MLSRQTARKPLPAFFYRLPARSQRCYLQSEAIENFPDFAPNRALAQRLGALVDALEAGGPREVQHGAESLMTALCHAFGVTPIRVEVLGVRPHNSRGELHGLFRLTRPPEIQLWMRTAQRHAVVKPRTFVRTLLHELCHYLDYSMLKLDDSYHTMGFFKRESFLVRALMGQATTD
jgi:hypothetical protein